MPYTQPGTQPGTLPGTQPGTMPGTEPGAQPGAQPGEAGQQPSFTPDAFAGQTERGGEAASSLTPTMFGDLIGFFGTRVVYLPGGATASGNVARVVAPVPYGAAYKVTENESPRPQNRVYFNYNFYKNVTQNVGGVGFGGVPSGDLHREMIGFERTFLDGDASIGARLPFQQLVGSQGLEDSTISDLTFILKYAWINDRITGDVASGGLLVTVPTGSEGIQIPGQSTLHPTFFQPWVGFIKNWDMFYVQGFSSVIVPTDFRDVSVLFNSVSAGYWAYKANSCAAGDCRSQSNLLGIIPIAELHVSTPLNHRGLDNVPIGYQDVVNFTGGVQVLFQQLSFGVALGAPITGPQPYDYEVAANVNFRW